MAVDGVHDRLVSGVPGQGGGSYEEDGRGAVVAGQRSCP
jgi:hypothetical protein